MIRLREYEDASKLIRRLREELRCTSAKAAGASKPRKAKLQAEVKRLSTEIERLELRKATIREQSGPFKEKLINEDRFREMADTREQRQIGLQPESQVDDESDDDQQQAPPGSLQSHPQATCSELPAGQAAMASGRSSAGSGEDSDSSGQGGALMAEIKLLESPVCLQNFHLGDDLPEEAPGGHKKAKKTKPKLQEAVQRLCETQLCSRQKRDVTGTKKRRHAGSRSLLHLVPQSIYSNDFQDCTEISWKVSLHEGKSLEAEGKSVQVKHSGIYSIYSQVFYTDTTYTMGHIILRQTDGDSEGSDILLRCVQSMPGDKSLAFNTCYTSERKCNIN
ncbi:tumor necrosis factor ligand superfamily member 13 isoform X2 [Phyllobates terribilis]|uniref:tumor necrosis factor ligand superfamily member 13 isoform X2 n=1 Tax=Phyllobates terribilis TaxID=111132 RepID=UPI003CCAE4CE